MARDSLYNQLLELKRDLKSFPKGSPFYNKIQAEIDTLKNEIGNQSIMSTKNHYKEDKIIHIKK